GNVCTTTVANARPGCFSGGCSFACNGGYTNCGGDIPCVDLYTDAQHCGGCYNVCPEGQACVNRQCTPDCPAGTTRCSQSCVDLNTTWNNCGACGNVCTAPANGTAFCSNGSCDFTCNT